MHRLMVSVLSMGLLAGCATSQPYVQPAPMPTDIGWVSPRVEAPPEPPPVPPRPASPVEQVLACDDGIPVKVAVGVTSGLALQFEPGVYIPEIKGAYEEFVPADEEDKQPWKAVIGKPGGKYVMVYLTANRPGMTTSFMIPTSHGLCLVDARSVAISKARVVRVTTGQAQVATTPKPPALLPDPMAPAQYHTGYVIEPASGGPTWTPTQVLDNGRRTFVVFPRNLSVMAAPMARMIGNNGPELINPVLVDHVLVLDHLVPIALELRLGSTETAEVVRITRQAPRTITCPADPECPVWPETVLAGR